MIEIRDIHKSFGSLKVLDGIDLQLDDGGIFAILGPNGSGKTTLIKTVLGMVLPGRGDILINGVPVEGRHDYRRNIGYLPQIAHFPPNLTVTEFFSMIRDIRQQESFEEHLIDSFGLEPFLTKRLGHLSGGTLQKVNIVQSMMFDPALLILDEPTAGLDPVARVKLKDLIRKERERGKTILITTHVMSLVQEVADQLVFLLEGKVYYKGAPRDLINEVNADTLEHAIALLMSDAPTSSSNGNVRDKRKRKIVVIQP